MKEYFLFYCLFVLFYLWFRHTMLFIKKDKEYKKFNGKISVVIPFYNEKKKFLLECINSVINAKGDKEIIVVNDGSSGNFNFLKKINEIKYISYQKNKGKRYAQIQALKI